MSWEAVSWANRQRLKLPQEQLVLLVLANCADPGGVAFAEWKGRDHWWNYLVERTRLSKASLFRHLNTIEQLGLGLRSTLVLADGSKRPIIRLDLSVRYDVDEVDPLQSVRDPVQSQGATQSYGETEDDEAPEDAENDNDISTLEAKNEPEKTQSHGETGLTVRPSQSHGETGSLDSNIDSKSPPLPPSGGASVRDELFDQFVASWREPIPKMALARSAWDHIATAKRAEAVAAAKGYFAWLASHPKPPAAVSAQSFLRDEAGWAQWLRYVPDASGAIPSISTAYALTSPEGKALCVLHEIAGLSQYLRSIMVRNGAVNYLRPMTPRLQALQHAGPRDDWVKLNHQQAGAWEGLMRDSIGVATRRQVREGSTAPWHWPPKVDGTVYTSQAPPELMTDQDYQDFK